MKSVFVVEDDFAVGETIQAILEESTYRVRLFTEPADLPNGPAPALVITDLASRDGYCSQEAVRDVRALRVRTAAPILVLTAHGAARSDADLAREVSAVMTKPFEMDELLAMVERLAL